MGRGKVKGQGMGKVEGHGQGRYWNKVVKTGSSFMSWGSVGARLRGIGRGSAGARLRGMGRGSTGAWLRGRGSAGVRLRDMGRGNHAITALKVIKRNQVKMIKNS